MNTDKYEAVMQLKNKDWSDDRIAHELHMGIEEVRLVADMRRLRSSGAELSAPAGGRT